MRSPHSLFLLPLLALGCAAAQPTLPRDRRTGPENHEECPGPRWSGEVEEYDLGAGPHLSEFGVAAQAGERVVASAHRTRHSDGVVEARLEWSADGRSWSAVPAQAVGCESSDSGRNGELGASASDCVGIKQVRLGHALTEGPRRFRLVLRRAGPGQSWSGRVRLQVVPGTCRALDSCWRASGNNCDGAPLSNCEEDEAGRLTCPTSVGSQAHDSCCSRWGAGAYVCGHCGSALNDRAQLAGCLLTDPPAGLEQRLVSRPAEGFPGGYVPCRAEWDLAFRDVAALPSRLHSFTYDPLVITWRPREVTRLTVVRGKAAAIPLPGAHRFPPGAHLRRIDAELGWCASERWHEVSSGLARCE